ncbi:MAG TPA: SHOCT domain-containing protein [Gaiellaceae bacterium]
MAVALFVVLLFAGQGSVAGWVFAVGLFAWLALWSLGGLVDVLVFAWFRRSSTAARVRVAAQVEHAAVVAPPPPPASDDDQVELSPANVEAGWRDGETWLTWESPRNFVAGESHYMPALRELTGEPRESGYLIPVEVAFVRERTNEYDSNAWRAEVDGRLIGYARRNLAEQFAAALDPYALTTFTVCGVIRGGSIEAPNLGVHIWPGRRPCPGPELHQVDEALSVPWPPSGTEGVHCSNDEEQRLARPTFVPDSRPAADRFDEFLRWGRDTITAGGPEDRALEALKGATAIATASEDEDQKEAAAALAERLMGYARGTLTLERAARIKKRLEPKTRRAKTAGPAVEERLSRLKNLLDRGVITDDEYAAQRAAIIKRL